MNQVVKIDNSLRTRHSLSMSEDRVQQAAFLDEKVYDHMKMFVKPGMFAQAVVDGVVKAARKTDTAKGEDIEINGRVYDMLAKRYMFGAGEGRKGLRRVAFKIRKADSDMLIDKGYGSPSLANLFRCAISEMWNEYFRTVIQEGNDD